MKLQVKDIIHKHKNSPCILLCHGPSLNDITDKLQQYKDDGYILIGCNEWPLFYNVEPQYWTLCGCMIQELINLEYKINSTLFYSDSIDVLDKSVIEKYVDDDYLPFYQRKDNFANAKMEDIDMDRPTIQEELQSFTKYKDDYGIGSNVSLHMLALAVLLGCNPIYMAGIDLEFKEGYAKHKDIDTKIDKSLKKFDKGWEGRFDPFKADYIKSLKIINESAKKMGTNIINLNKDSWFDEIEKGEIK